MCRCNRASNVVCRSHTAGPSIVIFCCRGWVNNKQRLHLPPRSYYLRHIPADSLGASKKQPKVGESCTSKAFLGSFFTDGTIHLYFKDDQGEISSNTMNRSDLLRCNDFDNLALTLKRYLVIPENEKLQIGWGPGPVTTETKEDLGHNWKQVDNIVPSEHWAFRSWRSLKSLEVLCCEPHKKNNNL